MQKTEKRRSFIIDFAYLLLWAAIIYAVLKYAMPFLMPFVMAFVLASILKPLINFLDRKLPFNRKHIASFILTIFYIIFGVVVFFAGTKIITSLGKFFSNIPSFYQQQILPAIENIGALIEDFIVQLDPSFVTFFNKIADSLMASFGKLVTDISGAAIGSITNIATAVPGFITSTFLMIISSFFFTVDYYRISTFFKKQISEKAERKLFIIKDYVINVLFGFLKAYAKIILLTFTELLIGLLILRVPYAPLIALGIAFMDILPVLGSGTILIPWSLYNIILGDFWLGIGLLILYAVITIVRQLAEPRIVGDQIGLYPLLTLVAMFVGARLFGIWGLFGFPIALTVLIHLNKAGEITIFKNYDSDESKSHKDKKNVLTFLKGLFGKQKNDTSPNAIIEENITSPEEIQESSAKPEETASKKHSTKPAENKVDSGKKQSKKKK